MYLFTMWVDRRKPPQNGSNLKISRLSAPWVAACCFVVLAKSLVLVVDSVFVNLHESEFVFYIFYEFL